MAQTAIVVDMLPAATGAVEVVPITTRGDRISRRHPDGGWVEFDGQFTRDLELALLGGEVDIVVHSYKDLPTEVTPGLRVVAVPPRGDARDCVVGRDGTGLDGVPAGGRVGTSSPRRAAQLRAVRPDITPVPIRGNVETRLRRLHDGELDGLVLAAAGLDRLGVEVAPAARLDFAVMLPAPSQGALAIQARSDDDATADLVSELEHAATRTAVEAERALLREIGGGCLAPLGALGEARDGRLRLRAAFETASGDLARADAEGDVSDPAAVVSYVAGRIAAAAATVTT